METGHAGRLPSGLGICCSIPDLFYLPEIVFGGLVWTLVASTFILPYNPQAYVMAVSVFCFTVTFIWMMIFACGSHHNRASWATADVAYHFLATVLYLSASVLLAYITINLQGTSIYTLDIPAVVFSFVATLLYFIHTIFSAFRWKTY